MGSLKSNVSVDEAEALLAPKPKSLFDAAAITRIDDDVTIRADDVFDAPAAFNSVCCTCNQVDRMEIEPHPTKPGRILFRATRDHAATAKARAANPLPLRSADEFITQVRQVLDGLGFKDFCEKVLGVNANVSDGAGLYQIDSGAQGNQRDPR